MNSRRAEMYRQMMLTDQKGGKEALDHLARTDYQEFLAVCDDLLVEESEVSILRAVFSLLGQKGEKDALAESRALEAIDAPELQHVALFALGKVASPKSYPLLFKYAEQGIAEALSALNRLPLSERDQDRLVNLARTFVFSRNYEVVEASLGVLLHHSSVQAEEQLLLQAAQQYYNENIVGALEEASSAVIPSLQAMIQNLQKDTVEFKDVQHTLNVLTQRYRFKDPTNG